MGKTVVYSVLVTTRREEAVIVVIPGADSVDIEEVATALLRTAVP